MENEEEVIHHGLQSGRKTPIKEGGCATCKNQIKYRRDGDLVYCKAQDGFVYECKLCHDYNRKGITGGNYKLRKRRVIDCVGTRTKS